MTKIYERALVCGGRHFNDVELMENVFNILIFHGMKVLIHGDARGADRMADKVAAAYPWINVIKFPADWELFGKAAGIIRNNDMLVSGKPDLVVAFPGGRGTEHMVSSALKHSIPVYIIKKSVTNIWKDLGTVLDEKDDNI